MSKLFEPIDFIRGPKMKNRFMLAPLTNSQSHDDGKLSEEEYHWLTMRAKGGFGLTMTCAAHVQAVGQGFPGQLGVFDDDHLPGLSRLAAEIKANDSVSICQVHHAGMRSPADIVGTPVCPSDNDETGARGLSNDEVKNLVNDFVEAAVRCEKAGFDGVELHGAHQARVLPVIEAHDLLPRSRPSPGRSMGTTRHTRLVCLRGHFELRIKLYIPRQLDGSGSTRQTNHRLHHGLKLGGSYRPGQHASRHIRHLFIADRLLPHHRASPEAFHMVHGVDGVPEQLAERVHQLAVPIGRNHLNHDPVEGYPLARPLQHGRPSASTYIEDTVCDAGIVGQGHRSGNTAQGDPVVPKLSALVS
ncbi:MAG: hypothetical protein H8D71_00820 [Deltaproteobacteria bacterium]|nr:hypothetical protein [Deltaproteobacteria bacterium]